MTKCKSLPLCRMNWFVLLYLCSTNLRWQTLFSFDWRRFDWHLAWRCLNCCFGRHFSHGLLKSLPLCLMSWLTLHCWRNLLQFDWRRFNFGPWPGFRDGRTMNSCFGLVTLLRLGRGWNCQRKAWALFRSTVQLGPQFCVTVFPRRLTVLTTKKRVLKIVQTCSDMSSIVQPNDSKK